MTMAKCLSDVKLPVVQIWFKAPDRVSLAECGRFLSMVVDRIGTSSSIVRF